MSDLQIFELGIHLAKALGGDKEAIADVKRLYNRHPEMFDNLQDVLNTINEVIKNPEYIEPNPKAKNNKDFMAYKQLDDRKMGDVGIRNDEGTNVIFHANKKNIDKVKEKQVLVEASSASAAPTRLNHYASKSNDLPMCNEALSTPTNDIIPNSKEKSQVFDSNDSSALNLIKSDELSTTQRQDNKKDLSWESAVFKSKVRKQR